MFHRILVCTDFTDGLQRLVQFVPQLASSGMKQIVFLHIVPLSEGKGVPKPDVEKVDRARSQLAPAQENIPNGVEVQIEVQSGKPVDVILRTAKTYQSEVILIGTQSRNLFTEKLFGSTTIGLAQRSTIPLMAVRPQLISAMTSEELSLRCQHLFRALLIPYDGDDASKYTIAQVAKFANGSQICNLCRVVESGRFELSPEEEQRIISETLKPAQAQLQAVGLKTEIEVRKGNAIVQILQAAQDNDASAIALSSTLENHGFGSVPSFAAELLRRSIYPILLFPGRHN